LKPTKKPPKPPGLSSPPSLSNLSSGSSGSSSNNTSTIPSNRDYSSINAMNKNHQPDEYTNITTSDEGTTSNSSYENPIVVSSEKSSDESDQLPPVPLKHRDGYSATPTRVENPLDEKLKIKLEKKKNGERKQKEKEMEIEIEKKKKNNKG